jgi:hypothetical protein
MQVWNISAATIYNARGNGVPYTRNGGVNDEQRGDEQRYDQEDDE